MIFALYRFVLFPIAWVLFQIGGLFGGEKWRQLRAAKNAGTFRFNRLDAAKIRAAHPVWIHAASGEIEYARPVLRELKSQFPEVPIVVTYGSVSAIRILERLTDVDAWGPVPWETRTSVRGFLREFRPRALLIARTDAWPVLLDTVAAAKIPSLLFAATFAKNSSRLRGFARPLTARALSRLDAIQVVADEDREILRPFGLDDKITVAGDTRFDQVFHRLAHGHPLPPELAPTTGPVLIAGSTWPEDEIQLLPALARSPAWRLLLAPHEIGEHRLRTLEEDLRRLGLESQRFSGGGPWTKRVLLVDRIGLLAELYAWGDLAFVGGSFRRQVHSVMEALAAGRRVLVGPFHANNREALAFQSEKIGGRSAVLVVHNTADIEAALSDPQLQEDAAQIRAAVEARRGATGAVLNWCTRNGTMIKK